MGGSGQPDNQGEGTKKDSSLELPDTRAMPSRVEGVVSRLVGGETILVPTKSRAQELDDIFTLNEVATSVWEQIDGTRTVADISAAVASEYDVTVEQALIDTRELIAMFQEAEVIQIRQPDS